MSRESAAASAQTRIKQYLLDNHLHPGDPLPTEAVLCERLGVSRSSVREAIRTLAALDIVDVRHGHGTFVGDLSLSPLVEGLTFRGILSPGDDRAALREVVELRTLLDLGLAEQVCAALRGTDDPRIDALVDEMVERAAAGEAFAVADKRFHQLILEPVPNTLLRQLVEGMWEVHTAVTPRVGVPTPADIHATAAAHGAMLRAARAGDVEAYRRAVREHYAPLISVINR